VTCLDAPVDRERFARAMPWIQSRYPLLAASLEVTDGEPRFVTGRAPPISVTWRERSGADDWRALVASEMSRGFGDEGPFIRFVVVADASTTDIILCVSHMLMDGLSMAQVTNDLIQCLDDPDRPVKAVEEKGPLDARAPRSYQRQWFPLARYVASQVWAAPHDPARNARLAARYRGRDKVDLVTLELAPEKTERLRALSRAQGTTVQGALTGAVAIAVGEREARFGRKRISVHSPINLRKLLEPAVVEEIGNYAAASMTWVASDGSLWDIARQVRGDIEKAIVRGDAFATERLMKGAKRKKPRTSPRWLALRLWPDIGVTNLGQVTVPDTPTGARVREMHVSTALPVMETLVCATVTVKGRLFSDFSFCPDDISRGEVVQLAESVRRQLDSVLA
jgi:NRPS condensation-like uncharacterized protein